MPLSQRLLQLLQNQGFSPKPSQNPASIALRPFKEAGSFLSEQLRTQLSEKGFLKAKPIDVAKGAVEAIGKPVSGVVEKAVKLAPEVKRFATEFKKAAEQVSPKILEILDIDSLFQKVQDALEAPKVPPLTPGLLPAIGGLTQGVMSAPASGGTFADKILQSIKHLPKAEQSNALAKMLNKGIKPDPRITEQASRIGKPALPDPSAVGQAGAATIAPIIGIGSVLLAGGISAAVIKATEKKLMEDINTQVQSRIKQGELEVELIRKGGTVGQIEEIQEEEQQPITGLIQRFISVGEAQAGTAPHFPTPLSPEFLDTFTPTQLEEQKKKFQGIDPYLYGELHRRGWHQHIVDLADLESRILSGEKVNKVKLESGAWVPNLSWGMPGHDKPTEKKPTPPTPPPDPDPDPDPDPEPDPPVKTTCYSCYGEELRTIVVDGTTCPDGWTTTQPTCTTVPDPDPDPPPPDPDPLPDPPDIKEGCISSRMYDMKANIDDKDDSNAIQSIINKVKARWEELEDPDGSVPHDIWWDGGEDEELLDLINQANSIWWTYYAQP